MKGKQISLSVFYDCMMAYNMLKLENTVSGYKPHVSHTNPLFMTCIFYPVWINNLIAYSISVYHISVYV
jgi:hypothetical protein